MEKLFYLLFGTVLLLSMTACTWQGGDPSLYPLPGKENDKYIALAGVWEGKCEKEINISATLNYNKNSNKFRLDITLINDNNKKKMIIATMTGTFSDINDSTYFCAFLDSEELQKMLNQYSKPDDFFVGPLVYPVSYIVKIEVKDNTINICPLYYAHRDNDGKFENKVSDSINFDPKLMLLLNNQEQLVEIIRKKEYIAKPLTTLTRKTITTPPENKPVPEKAKE